MANPQLENGFIQIANDIFEPLMLCKITIYERAVIDCVLRKTYGWKKKMDWISNSQISDATGIARSHVTRTVKALVEKKILVKENKKLGFQKDCALWNVEWRKLPLQVTIVTSTGNKKLPLQVPTKEKKETITKEGALSIVKHTKYIDYDTGDVVEDKPKEKAKNKEVVELCKLFEERGEKATGVKPDLTRAYFKMLNAMKAHSLSTEDVKDLFNHFFSNGKLTPEQHVSLGLCISGAYITQWKASKKNKQVSQVDASIDLIL